MFDEPELHVVRFPQSEEWKLARERQEAEARRRCIGWLHMLLVELGLPVDEAERWSEALFEGLFVVRAKESGEPCVCSCHPRPSRSDFHDYGAACPCQRTAEERRRHWREWQRDNDRYWASPEGKAATARRQAEEDELVAWLAGEPGVVVTSYGGFAPEQWRGSVDGHPFYFRERHGSWRIELDLRPSGRVSRVWKGGDLDDDDSFDERDIEEGDVIAEGVEGASGYGERPVERAQFIVGIVRDHIRRQECTFHSVAGEVERAWDALRVPISWCPRCGARLEDGTSTA